MSEVTEYISMAVGAVSVVGVGIVTIWSTRQDAARAEQRRDMDAMADQISDGGTRLTKIEAEMAHIPKTADVGRLYEKLNEMSNAMSKIAGSQETLLAVFGGASPAAVDRRAIGRKR